MENILFLVVGGIIYIGSGALGVALFGEGAGAAFFALILGSLGFYSFYYLVIKNKKD